MKNDKMKNNRRKLLKSIAAGSGAVIAGKSLPGAWERPVVDAVMLPAHAQTSTAICIAGPISSTSDATEGVVILFDGVSSCSLVLIPGVNGGDSGNPDEMLLIDNDYFPSGINQEFDIDGPAYGANWSNDGPDLSAQPPETYSFVRTRTSGPNTGVSFRVTFTVSFSPTVTMTVSNVIIELA